MMKTLKKLFPFVFLLILIIFSSISSLVFIKVQALFETFFFSLIPLLAPTILFDCLFVNSGGLDILCELCNHKSNLFLKIIIIIIGIIGGSASLSFYIKHLIKRNILSIKEDVNLACATYDFSLRSKIKERAPVNLEPFHIYLVFHFPFFVM